MRSASGFGAAVGLCAILLLATSGCDWFGGDSESKRERLDLVDDVGEIVYTIADNTDVFVEGSIEFLSPMDSSVFIGADVVFWMGPNARLTFQAPPILPVGRGCTIRAQVADQPWSRVALEGELSYRLENWRIQDGIDGLLLNAHRVDLVDCDFSQCESYGLYNVSADSVALSGCRFTDCRTAVQTDAGWLRLSHCTLENGEIGVLTQGYSIELEDCTFRGYVPNGLRLIGGSDSPGFYAVRHCLFENCDTAVRSISSRPFVFEDNIVRDCRYHDLDLRLQITAYPFTIRNNQLLDVEDGWTVRFHNYTFLNAEANWWGTTDSLQIRARIFDHYADESIAGIVNFMPPLMDAPVNSGPR